MNTPAQLTPNAAVGPMAASAQGGMTGCLGDPMLTLVRAVRTLLSCQRANCDQTAEHDKH